MPRRPAKTACIQLFAFALSVAACGARSPLRAGSGGASTGAAEGGAGGKGCAAQEVACNGSCCDGVCLAGACESIVTVPDCKRTTPQAKPIAILRSTDVNTVDVDLQNIAVDEGFVYYVTDGHITRVPSVGGSPQIVSTEAVGPTGLSTSLVVNGAGAFFEGQQGVFRAVFGTTTQLGSATAIGYTRHLALTSHEAVVVDWNTSDLTFLMSSVSFAGNGVTSLYTSPPGQFQTITADAEAAYFSITSGVYRLPMTGAAPTLLTSLPVDGGPAAIAVDDSFVYGSFDSTDTGRRLEKIDKINGGKPDLIANATALHIELDDQSIYVNGGLEEAKKTTGGIFRLDKNGAHPPVQMVKTDFDLSPNGGFSYVTSALAVDSDRIYFIESCQGMGPDFGAYRLVTIAKDYALP